MVVAEGSVILEGVVIDENGTKFVARGCFEANQPSARVVDNIPVKRKVHRTRAVLKKEAIIGRLEDFIVTPRHVLIGGVGVQDVFMLLAIIICVIDEAVLYGAAVPTAASKRFARSVNAHVVKEHVRSVCALAIGHDIYPNDAAARTVSIRNTNRAVDFNVGKRKVVDRLTGSTPSSLTSIDAITVVSRDQDLNAIGNSSIVIKS